MSTAPGADLLCAGLADLGVTTVFALPGSQNVALFESLRRSGLRTVVPVHELGAAFAAAAWGRVTALPGVVAVIPGPGFAWALPAVAEASHDSAPMLLLVAGVPPEAGSPLRLQWLDQPAMAGPVVRARFRARTAAEIGPVLAEAWHAALEGEPGPVLLEVETAALEQEAPAAALSAARAPSPDPAAVEAVIERMASARRPLLFVGQGVGPAAAGLRELAERLASPVATTLSARGALPDDHPLALAVDLGGAGVHHLNEMVAAADLILALGAKFAHNGTGGFRLVFPPERLVRVDASRRLLELGPPASLAIAADVPGFTAALLAHPRLPNRRAAEPPSHRAATPPDRLAGQVGEPAIAGASVGTPAELFALLRELLPRDAIVVTDSGRHQVLVREHYPVLAPGGLLAPSDFQSMGFALPSAIGAALAVPGRRVVAVLGDGGLAMSGLELVTAARLGLPLVVLVLCDGAYGLIRDQQVREFGASHGTDLAPLDTEALAAACGVAWEALEGDARQVLRRALDRRGPVLVEVRLGETAERRAAAAQSAARGLVRRALPRGVLARLRQLLGRR